MKIGVIVPHLKKYGGIRRYLEFGNQLIKKGHDYRLYVIDTREDYPWVRELNFQGKIYDIDNLVSNELDACICGDAGSLSYLDKANVTLKVVNVIFPIFSSYLLGNYADYISRDDLLVVGNGTNWPGLVTERSNWYTIPGAVNLDMFKPIDIKRKDNRFKILFMAKNRPWKGLDKIIEAYNVLKDQEDFDWYFFDTEPHTNLPEKFKGLINLPQSQMPELYSQVDCFISMEELAGWQNCAAEAMACGCPVITTQIGAVDFAINGKTAIIVEDVNELVKSILLLKKSVKMRQRLAKAGLEVIKNFSWDKYADKWIDLLASQIIVREEAQRTDLLINVPKVCERVVKEASKVAELIPKKIQSSPKTNDDQTSAIRAKADELRKFYSTYRKSTSSIATDRYEEYGPYHWNAIGKDMVYTAYVEMVKKIFKGIVDYYGIQEVLDVGGGDGCIAGQLNELGFPVRLIEINAVAVELAKMKLKGRENIKIENKNFFDIVEASPYMLLSQIIEHFDDPSLIIDRIHQFKPEIVLVSTPIQKDFGMWDPDYHVQEFSEDQFMDLFKPLINDYMISHTALKPHNQILFLERKDKSVERYFRNLIDQTIDEGICVQILETINSIFSLEVKRN